MGLGGGACVAFLLHCIVSGGAQVAARQLRRLLQREGGQTLSQRSKEQPWGHQVAAWRPPARDTLGRVRLRRL